MSFSRNLSCALLALFSTLLAMPLRAQEHVTPAAAFREARTLYYTPVDHGLQGFQCDVSFDWRQFMEKATNGPVDDANQRLAYLRGVKLTVVDDLHGGGELRWAAPAPPPEGSENSIAQIRNGLQQIWTGFFQSWNGFFTGDMFSVSDNQTRVERTPTGYHVFTKEQGKVAEEMYSGDFTLQSVHVSTPELDSTLMPVFERTAHGRLVTQMDNVLKQPPTAPGTKVNMTVHYAPVDGFQIPSQVLIDVAGMANFDFHLSGCTVHTQRTTPEH